MVDKKIKGIEIIMFLIVVIVLSLAILNAYHISTVFYNMPIEQSYIYDTIFIGVLLTIGLMYIAVFVIYKNQKFIRAFILVRLFIPIVLCLYNIGYLVGLNLDSNYTYHFLTPVWIYALVNIGFMSLNIFIFGRVFYLKKYKKIINIYTVIIIVLYLIMFFTIISDSAVGLGLLDWE